MADCNHDCSSCGESCAERDPKSFLEAPNKDSNIKRVIGVVSGKGGVGKSLVTSLLATCAAKSGQKAGILDADITGPSIPRMFGIDSTQAMAVEEGILPTKTAGGISVMSINLLLQDSSDPVIWRGPVIAGAVKQFWTDVIWGDLDVLFVDMPPGTGDVPLTVFQSLPLDGIVIVTSPQELVSMIVGKAVRMAQTMNIPVLGLVENMSYFKCPDCGKEHAIFGDSKVEALAKQYGIAHFAKLPIDPVITTMVDAGEVESVTGQYISPIVDVIQKEV